MAQGRVTLVRVIDGDTVVVLANRGALRKPAELRIRMYGIDAPESSQKGGPESTRHLERLIGSRRKLWMESVDTDQYGRTVGILYEKRNRPDNSYNYMMVRDGQARAYMPRAADRERFKRAEDEANRRNRGIWKDKKAQAPWDYRKEQRQKEQRRGKARTAVIIVLAAAGAALCLWLGLSGAELPGMPGIPEMPSLPDIPGTG